MRTTKLIFGLCLGLAACGGKGNTSDSDSDTSSGGGSSSTGEQPTTGGSTNDGTTGTTGPSQTASSDPTTGPSQTASSDPTTGPAPTTGGTDPGETTGETTGNGTTAGTTGGTEETGVQPSGDAVVENDCAPNDGPAVLIKLDVAEGVCGAGWPGDQLRVVVFQGAPLPAGTYVLGDNNGFATLQIGMDPPMFSNEGSVTIESFTDQSVTGTYELTFPDNTMRAGSFTGPFCKTNPMCG